MIRLNRRSFMGGAAAAASLPVLASRANGAQQKDVTLSLWTHDGVYVKYFYEVAEHFRQRHPDINFTFAFDVTPDFFSVVVASLASGKQVGDLVGIEQGLMQSFMKNDIIADRFVDLSTVLTDDEFAMIPEAKWAPYRYEGRPYGIESVLAASVYYYQPEIFEKRGLAVPVTWEEFLSTGEALAKDGIALSAIPDGLNLIQMYMMQRGVQLFDSNHKFVLDEPKNHEQALIALQTIQKGLQVGAFKPYLGAEFWTASPIEGFRNGSVAGIIMPEWYSSFILKLQAEDMSGKWRVAQMPKYDDGAGFSTSVWGGVGFAINKQSPNMDLALDFIRYAYLDNDNRMLFFTKYGYFPIMPALYDKDEVKTFEDTYYGGQRIGEVMGSIADDIPVFYSSTLRSALEDATSANLPSFYNGSMTADAFLDSLIEAVQSEEEFSE